MNKASHPLGLLRIGLLLLALIPLAGCGGKSATKNETPKTVSDFFEIKIGSKTARLQLAISDIEQQQGLMFRKSLGSDEGMIFVYAKSRIMGFWMRNTALPLDIGFFDENGVLLEIYPLHPFDETPVQSRSRQLKFAIEMNQGWYHANGVAVGAKLDLKALAAAMKARGVAPHQWGYRE